MEFSESNPKILHEVTYFKLKKDKGEDKDEEKKSEKTSDEVDKQRKKR